MKTLIYKYLSIIFIFSLILLLPLKSNDTIIPISKTSDEYLILVNKTNPLDKNYIPTNLIEINNIDYIERKNETMQINLDVYYYLILLFEEAQKHDLCLTVFSAYRSYEKQESIWNKNKDELYVAKPGYSEHQTGLAVDLSRRDIGLTNNFMYTKEYVFLKNNAHKFGFINRYPENKMLVTGYLFEPWHYRFVGISHAKAIYQNNLTLEEYLS